MRTDIIKKQQTAMATAGLDALIALSPENFAYGAGFVVPSQPLMRWRHAGLVVTAGGATGVLSVDMEETTVRGRLPDADIRMGRRGHPEDIGRHGNVPQFGPRVL